MSGPKPDPLLTFERLAALEKAVRRFPGRGGDSHELVEELRTQLEASLQAAGALRHALEAIADLPAGEARTAQRAREIASDALGRTPGRTG